MLNSDWYRERNDYNLDQGDIVLACPKIIIPTDVSSFKEIKEHAAVDVETFDVIIVSQSCDLANTKIKNVLVCPIYFLEYMKTVAPDFNNSNTLEAIRRGYAPRYHMLGKQNCDDDKNNTIQIIDFAGVFSISHELLIKEVTPNINRIGLNSPYKEHLSQAFARYFMRIGLPCDIPRFQKRAVICESVPINF